MGFLKSVAPAPFPGILLTLSSSVYQRLLPPADLSGCSKQAMVPHLHNALPRASSGKSIRCVCTRVAEVGRRSGVEKELGVGSVSHGFPGEVRGCQEGPEGHQQIPRHAMGFLITTPGCVVADSI